MIKHRLLISAAAALVMALVGCSSDKKKEKDAEAPLALAEFPATLRVERVWEAGVSGKPGPLRLALSPAVDGDRVFATGTSGEVAAFELKSGRKIWEKKIKATTLSGATGAGGGLVVVASNKGDVFGLDSGDGSTRWRVRVGGEVLAPAAVSATLVVVRTVDGKLHALAPATGKELWLQEQQIPRLTLRGTASPVIAGDIVLCGFDNGKVIAVNQSDGSLLWEATVSPPKGRTELERLVDIDSAVHVIDQDVYVVGFQGRAAMLALDSGQVWWARDFSSYHGLDADEDQVYISTAGGEVVGLQRKTGTELWRQSKLLRRGLSGPAVAGDAVVVGDSLGFIHWLDRTTGKLAARTTLKGRISTPPVVAGDLVIIANNSGKIAAYRASRIGGAVAAAGAGP